MKETFNIHDRGAPDGSLPGPWYRPPPDVTEGPRRTRASIIGGLLIDNEEGRRWFKKTYDIELAANHRQDINVNIRLRRLLCDKEIEAFDCCTAPRRLESTISDFLVITHIESGPFTHNGPEAYEEVYDEDRIPIPGMKEKRVEAELLKLGIAICGYKSYYSNAY